MARFGRTFLPPRRLEPLAPFSLLTARATGVVTFTGTLTATVTVVTADGSVSFTGTLIGSVSGTTPIQYATLTDVVTGTSISFLCDPDVKLGVYKVGSESYPMGYRFAREQTDGQKGWDAQMVIVSTSPTMDASIKTLVDSPNPLRLILPDGRTGLITFKSVTQTGAAPFALWNWSYINRWTVAFVQIGA